MAYVRKTDMLVQDITKKVREMKDQALKMYSDSEVQPDTPEYNGLVEAVMAAAYQDMPHLRGKLPDTWLKKTNRLRVKYQGNNLKRFEVSLDSKDDSPFELPYHLDSGYYSTEVEIGGHHCNSDVKLWIDNREARYEQRRTVSEQYDKVEATLQQFMGAHASLNSALKEMPELEMYVPAKYMAKYHEATEPRAKKEKQSLVEELNIDVNELSSIAIAHRITTAAE